MTDFTIKKIRNGRVEKKGGAFFKPEDTFSEALFHSFEPPSFHPIGQTGTWKEVEVTMTIDKRDFLATPGFNKFQLVIENKKDVPVLSEISEYINFFRRFNNQEEKRGENFLILKEREIIVKKDDLDQENFYLREGRASSNNEAPPFIFLGKKEEESKIVFERAIRSQAVQIGNAYSTGFILCRGKQDGEVWVEKILSSPVKLSPTKEPEVDRIGFRIPTTSFNIVIPRVETLKKQLGGILFLYQILWGENLQIKLEKLDELLQTTPDWVLEAGVEGAWDNSLNQRKLSLEESNADSTENPETLEMFEDMESFLLACYNGKPQEEDLLAFLEEHFIAVLGTDRLFELRDILLQ